MKLIFERPILQRSIYGIVLLFIIVGFLINDRMKILFENSSVFGLQYIYVLLITILPLLYQVIFNNKLGWVLILILGLIHFGLTISNILGNPYPTNGTPLVIIFYLLAIGVLILIYPKKKIKP